MADRIAQIERLNRLRAEGALTDEEFEREKMKLLEGRVRAAPALGLVIGILCALGLIAFLVTLLLRGSAAPAPGNAAEVAAVDAAAPAQSRPATPAPPRPHDISSPVTIANGECSFAPDLRRAFENMLHSDGDRATPRAVRFGDMTAIPSVRVTNESGVAGFSEFDATVTLPRPLLWNGLRLTGLAANMGWEWRYSTLVFADPPARVRAALARMGIRIPASGTLELPADACPSGVSVAPRGSGAMLTCGGGC
jgi:hypothetical protein